ncbi:MAG: YCF48-related protein [Candidatus Eisenbacteria bacterium]
MDRRDSYRFVTAVSFVAVTFGLILVSSAAFGFQEGVIVRVEKPVSTETLSQAGMFYLADLGEAYLVQGSPAAARRLAESAADFRVMASLQAGKSAYLLRPRRSQKEMPYSVALVEVARGVYLAQMDMAEAEDPSLLQFSKARLVPYTFIQREPQVLPYAPAAITPKPQIVGLVAEVSGDSLWRYISQLSGEEGAVINGVPDTILTRYSFSTGIDNAADYLCERFEEYGVDVEFQEYVQGRYDFYDLDFINENCGWVVGYQQRIYKTTDAGLTWTRQKTFAFNDIYIDVCFIDSLEGWICGVSAAIYHTADGGASWTRQTASTGSPAWLNDICFIDSLNGWVAGQNGSIASTTDGGNIWGDDVTGTTEAIYGLWFRSADRGWACGDMGTILFWDGISWTSQTSGASDFLRDVCFIDDNTGWVVGADRTLLKTTDGGQNWIAQTVPGSPNPYLMDVCFIDSLEGWVAEYDGTILHTTDSGASWEIQHAEGSPALYGIDVVSASHGWAAGLSCAIQHTADGGDIWESQTTNLSTGAWKLNKNVVATKPGTVSDEQVIICGHYDSISEVSATLAPGADDNASGTSAVVEAARVMADFPCERTIKFVCFAGEEQGLLGSSEYAGRALYAGDAIVGVLNCDMIAYVDSAPEDVNIVSDSVSEWMADLAIDCADAYVPTLLTRKIIDPDMLYSDHASFWRLGFNALDNEEDTPIVYPAYHTTGDRIHNLTQSFATNVAEMAVATLAELAIPDTSISGVIGSEITFIMSVEPNPFTATTRLRFALNAVSDVSVSLFDVEGRLVKTLVETSLPPGRHDAFWDGRDERGRRVSPGVYFASVETERASTHSKVVLLK